MKQKVVESWCRCQKALWGSWHASAMPFYDGSTLRLELGADPMGGMVPGVVRWHFGILAFRIWHLAFGTGSWPWYFTSLCCHGWPRYS